MVHDLGRYRLQGEDWEVKQGQSSPFHPRGSGVPSPSPREMAGVYGPACLCSNPHQPPDLQKHRAPPTPARVSCSGLPPCTSERSKNNREQK